MKHPGRRVNIHSDRCLCGSGRLMRECCLFVRCQTLPKPPGVSGISNPACFARRTRDCCKTISGEHYISKGILELFGNGPLIVTGANWLPKGEQAQVSIKSLTGNMLCKRHNQALSPLDTLAKKFFQFFAAEWSDEAVEVYLTRGFDLERWMLKLLCGLVASGNAVPAVGRVANWHPPDVWLDILFGSADVDSPAGLHAVTGRYNARKKSYSAVTLFRPNTAEPVGIVFAVEGILFVFSMDRYELPKRAKRCKAYYRPMAFQLANGDRYREAHFGWPDGEFAGFRLTEVKI